MNLQPELPFTGEQLKEAGMNLALESAEADFNGWADSAFSFLQGFILSYKSSFMAEDIRLASAGYVPEPPSKRAWGGIIARAAKAGLIRRVGFASVKNAKAHCTPASVWEAVNKF